MVPVLGLSWFPPRGDKLRYVLQIHFDSSNNEAEYEALLYGLHMAICDTPKFLFGFYQKPCGFEERAF